MFLLLVFLHLAFMFTAVAMAYGSQLLLLVAIRSNKADSVRGVASTTLVIGSLVPVLFVVGGLLGLAAAWVGGFPLLAPWLVISYVAFAILAISGVRLTGPNYDRLRTSLDGTSGGPIPPQAQAVIGSTAFRAGIALDFALLALLVADMVFKPFS